MMFVTLVAELDKMSANVRQKRQRSRNESGASDKSSNSEASNPTPSKVIFEPASSVA